MDILKQIEYWKRGSIDDRGVARLLIDGGKTLQGLFFVHLSLEKALKACVCSATGELAPKSHDLPRLAELARLVLVRDQADFLARMNLYSLEGRYPTQFPVHPNPQTVEQYYKQFTEVQEWLLEK
jgi:HEPN domain-containing protein